MMRDDEMINSNIGVFYDAPGYRHEDHFAFKLMRSMFGSYRID
jgi:processing peptidase subunit beta